MEKTGHDGYSYLLGLGLFAGGKQPMNNWPYRDRRQTMNNWWLQPPITFRQARSSSQAITKRRCEISDCEKFEHKKNNSRSRFVPQVTLISGQRKSTFQKMTVPRLTRTCQQFPLSTNWCMEIAFAFTRNLGRTVSENWSHYIRIWER